MNTKDESAYAALVYRYPNEGRFPKPVKRDAFAPTLDFILQISFHLDVCFHCGENVEGDRQPWVN